MSLLYHAEIFMLYQKNDNSCKILQDSKIIKEAENEIQVRRTDFAWLDTNSSTRKLKSNAT